jgi:FtsH-binding integral membrane protein
LLSFGPNGWGNQLLAGTWLTIRLALATLPFGLALGLLMAFGLLIGWSVATTVNYYASTDPVAVRQAFATTALFLAVLGTTGYAIRRDLSFLYRILFWMLLGLLVAGFVLIFVRIPAA